MLQISTDPWSTEEYVEELYKRSGIIYPGQIDFNVIAVELGIQLRQGPYPSKAFNESKIVIVDNRQDRILQREDAAHEIAHVVLHSGSQLRLPHSFIELQERQSNKLGSEFLVPKFMLRNILDTEDIPDQFQYAVSYLATEFYVRKELIAKKLGVYRNMLLSMCSI
jgi:Zn-dependent peptidase ImmA (M78 family)